MLWYLHFCSEAHVVVTEYTDHASAILEESENGNGKFICVTLSPTIVIAEESMLQRATELHKKANEFCFIANSLNFQVVHKPIISTNLKK